MQRKKPKGPAPQVVLRNFTPISNTGGYAAQLHQPRTRRVERKYDRGTARDLPKFLDCITNGLEVLWKQKLLCDVSVVVEGKTHLAHKVILSSCSDYFHMQFTEEIRDAVAQIEMKDVKTYIFEPVLECMYTGRIHLSDHNVKDYLRLAAMLHFYPLQDACEDYLCERLNFDNCLKYLILAFDKKLDKLSDEALEMVAHNFKSISTRAMFTELHVEKLLSILGRDDLQVDNELDVFKKVQHWIDSDRSSRIQYAANLLSKVRLPLLNPSVIVDHVEKVDYLMNIPACQLLIKDALHYHCIPPRQALLQSPRTVPRCKAKKDNLVAIGGAPRLRSDPVTDEVFAYDADKQRWQLVTRLPEARHHHAIATLGGFMYVVGGERTNDHCSPVNTAYRYDPRNGNWLQLASMMYRRESFQLGVLNGRIYAVGGRLDKDESLAEVERYNPATDKWEHVSPMSVPKRSVAVAALHGRLFAVGGSGKKMISSRVESYDPDEDKWEIKRCALVPRFFANLVAANGYLYLIGGGTLDDNGDITCVDTVDMYNTITNTWSTVCTMNTPRAEAGSCVIDSKIYVMGGYNWTKMERLKSVEALDLDTLRWKEVQPLGNHYTGICCVGLTLYDIPESLFDQTTASGARSPAVGESETIEVRSNFSSDQAGSLLA